MIQVRFHLGNGKHYKHWQVKDQFGNVEYHDPSEVTLVMYDCQLRNQPGTARRIFEGGDKDVCAWVKCRDLAVVPASPYPDRSGTPVMYNPRVAPYWRTVGDVNCDGYTFARIESAGRELFAQAS